MTSEPTLMVGLHVFLPRAGPRDMVLEGAARLTSLMPAVVFRSRSCLAVPWRSSGRRPIDPLPTSAIHISSSYL
jgi:hypothetical protein